MIECQCDVRSIKQLIAAYPKLLLCHMRKKYDIMIIPWRGIMTFPLAKLISKGPIVYFPYVSIYDTLVNNRKKFRKNSIQAKFIRLADKIPCKLSDVSVLENYETIKYFCTEYCLNPMKFRRLIWGADENAFPPLPIKKREGAFKVLFIGTFIPFHGVDIIVETARLLSNRSDIIFYLCGDGQTRKTNEELTKSYGLKNIHFLGFVEFSTLRKTLEDADVCLGVFGSLEQRTNAVANKLFQILASQKPLVTRDTPVMKEMCFINGENCMLVKPADPEDLAKIILNLKDDSQLCAKIAIEGYKIFKKITTESWDEFWSETMLKLKS